MKGQRESSTYCSFSAPWCLTPGGGLFLFAVCSNPQTLADLGPASACRLEIRHCGRISVVHGLFKSASGCGFGTGKGAAVRRLLCRCPFIGTSGRGGGSPPHLPARSNTGPLAAVLGELAPMRKNRLWRVCGAVGLSQATPPGPSEPFAEDMPYPGNFSERNCSRAIAANSSASASSSSRLL